VLDCPIKERFVGYHVPPTRKSTNVEMSTLNRKSGERKCSLQGSEKPSRCGCREGEIV